MFGRRKALLARVEVMESQLARIGDDTRSLVSLNREQLKSLNRSYTTVTVDAKKLGAAVASANRRSGRA